MSGTPPTEHELKLEYAKLLVANSGFTSERSVADDLLRKYFPSYDFQWCDYIAQNWTRDEIVTTEITRLRQLVPSTIELQSDMWRRMQHPSTTPQDYAKIAKVLSDSMGLGKVDKDADKSKGKDKLAELAAMVMGADDETTENAPVESDSIDGVVLTQV